MMAMLPSEQADILAVLQSGNPFKIVAWALAMVLLGVSGVFFLPSFYLNKWARGY